MDGARLKGTDKEYDSGEISERAWMKARDQVEDADVVARMNAAPNLGGDLLVELSQLVTGWTKSDSEHAS